MTASEAKKTIATLTDKINYHNDLYYQKSKAEITDQQFDQLLAELTSLEDQFLTFCYMFDPKMGVYTLSAFRVMQVGGVLTMLALGGLIGVMLFTERLKAKRLAEAKKVALVSGGGAPVGVSVTVGRT